MIVKHKFIELFTNEFAFTTYCQQTPEKTEGTMENGNKGNRLISLDIHVAAEIKCQNGQKTSLTKLNLGTQALV